MKVAATPFKIIDPSPIYALGLSTFLNSKGFKNININSMDDDIFHFKRDETEALDSQCKWIFYHVVFNEQYAKLQEDLKKMRSFFPFAKIIVYSANYSEKILKAIFTNNLNGYFLLSEETEVVLKLMKSIEAGELSLSPKISQEYILKKKMERFRLGTSDFSPVWSFSSKEQKVLSMLANDSPLAVIQDQLQVNFKRWPGFLNQLYKKLKVHAV